MNTNSKRHPSTMTIADPSQISAIVAHLFRGGRGDPDRFVKIAKQVTDDFGRHNSTHNTDSEK